MVTFYPLSVDPSPPVDNNKNGMRVASGDTYMGNSSPESAGPMKLSYEEDLMLDPSIVAWANSLCDEHAQDAQFTGQTQNVAQQPGSMSTMPIQAQNSVVAPIPDSLPFSQATEQQPQHEISLNTGSGHFDPSCPTLSVCEGQGQFRPATKADMDKKLARHCREFLKHYRPQRQHRQRMQRMQRRQGPSAAKAAQPVPTATVPVAAPKPPVRSTVTGAFAIAYQNLKAGNVFFEDGRLCVPAGIASEASTGKAYVVDKFEGDTVHFVKKLKDVKTMGFLAFPIFTEPREFLKSCGFELDHQDMYQLSLYNESSPIPAGEIIPGL